MLNKVRSILDLKTIVSKIRTLGAVTVANTHWGKFRDTAEYFERNILDIIEESELRVQFRDFNRRLEELGNERDSGLLSSIAILARFLDTRFNLYR